MTGEITLRGNVLPIGGLKEKVLAAHRGGIKAVVIPEENKKDINEIPQTVLKSVELILVSHMDDVLKRALVVSDPDALFDHRELDDPSAEAPAGFRKKDDEPRPSLPQ